ncbi:CopG family transcriptional regulator [Microlunatus sp. Y2014]|uniref:ribbon-helix-helix domain-containing protein n=1 Tax=Microlunatus sp. Y2014 TaxID=3418488 RepID=UPI003DA6FF9E
MTQKRRGRPARTTAPERTIGCMIETEVIDRLDTIAAASGVTRSEVLRSAVLDYIAAHADAPANPNQEVLIAS